MLEPPCDPWARLSTLTTGRGCAMARNRVREPAPVVTAHAAGWQRLDAAAVGSPQRGRGISCRDNPDHGLSPGPSASTPLGGGTRRGRMPPGARSGAWSVVRERRCQDAVACWSPTEWTGTPPTSSAWLGHGGHRTRVLRTARGRWAATKTAGGVPKPWGSTGVWSSWPLPGGT